MISDTISDAAYEIRRYLAEHPQTYAGMKDQIEALVSHMDAIRLKLDAKEG